jgi:hypothetical protein
MITATCMSLSTAWNPSRPRSCGSMRSGWQGPQAAGLRFCGPSVVLVRTWAPGRGRSCGPSSVKAMLIVDTGPLVAYLNRNDRDHERCAALLDSRTDDLLVTPYVATEACYLVATYVGAEAEINLVEALAAGDRNQMDVPAHAHP